jgi:tRNA-binding protein
MAKTVTGDSPEFLTNIKNFMEEINYGDFEKVELRVGTILAAEDFPEAKKPAFKLTIDFGEFGVKKSSVQITHLYQKEELVGTQVAAVLNFPPKQIGPFSSEVLTVGFPNEKSEVVLVRPDWPVSNGAKLF